MAWTERYVSVAGGGAHNGTTEADAWTLAEAIAAPYGTGQRINVKAGTYANTTTDRTFGVAGTTTAPIWWRGYNSTIGDLDADFTTAKPAITFTTGGMLVTAAHQWFSNLNISGARTAGPQVNFSGGNLKMDRCRVEDTAANAASTALRTITNAECYITRSWFKANASATRVIEFQVRSILAGNAIEGGGAGVNCTTGAVVYVIVNNVINNVGGDGVLNAVAGFLMVYGNSIYSAGGDGVEMSTLPASAIIANNIFDSNAGYGINNSTGANTNLVMRLHNAFYANGTAPENGFGDTPSLTEVTESASPFTNAGSSDFSLLTTALSKAAGLPGLFENQSYTSYLDIGAVQREEPAASGGVNRAVLPSGVSALG